VRESRERVRAAIVNSGFDFPLKRITASLAPADLRKAGPGFDLAIAAAILCASEQVPVMPLAGWWLAGELALDGSIRTLPGVIAMAERAAFGGSGIAVAPGNAGEAGLVEGVAVASLRTLADLAALARGELELLAPPRSPAAPPPREDLPDMADLRGQVALRSAMEVAAAGGHGLLIVGPPGAGKSLAARRLPSILPPLTRAEAIEVTRIASVAGRPPPDGTLCGRPFRAPHHTISPAGLVGGGSPPRAGEITLAHRGVLFLDEIGEFGRSTLEALRQPLEDGRVTISRARGTITMPARFQIVAAANPCPCGHGEESPRCKCRPDQIRAYEARLSGALADRFDLSLAVEQPTADELAGDPGEGSAPIAARVAEARERASARLGPGRSNSSMTEAELTLHAAPNEGGAEALAAGHESFGLSGRGWSRVLKVARTCADLDGIDVIGTEHIDRALSMRRRAKT
jgi:magnesium chelatase family protein